jgi:hypothetical protein
VIIASACNAAKNNIDILTINTFPGFTKLISVYRPSIHLATKEPPIENITKVEEDNYLDAKDPWKRIPSVAAFAVTSTFPITLRHTAGQLVFGKDMIFNVQHSADWDYIKQRKQKIINFTDK